MIRTLVLAASLFGLAAPAAAQVVETAPAVAAVSPDLVGAAEADVRARLGEPAIARREGQGAMWTYRRQGCSVFVFFQERPGEGLRVSSVGTGPREIGGAAPSLDVCLASPAA